MSRHDSKPAARTEGLHKSLHERRRAFERQALGVPGMTRLVDVLMQPSATLGATFALLFALAATLLVLWTRGQALVADGRVMNETRLVRVEQLVTVDEAQTIQRREAARRTTPRVYLADDSAIAGVIESIRSLPATLEGVDSITDVDPTIRDQFGLDQQLLESVQRRTAEGTLREEWEEHTAELATRLSNRPIIDAQTYQRSMQESFHSSIRLMAPIAGPLPGASSQPSPATPAGGASPAAPSPAPPAPLDPAQPTSTLRAEVPRSELVNLSDQRALAGVMDTLARDAGFLYPLREVVITRLTKIDKPTYTLDAAATAQAQRDAELSVQPVQARVPKGEVIFRRGDVLTQGQRTIYQADLLAFANEQPWLTRWLNRLAVAAACCGIVLAMSGYAVLFAPRIKRRAARVLGLSSLLLAALAIPCVGTVLAPNLATPLAVLPSAFITVLVCIGYDRRSALAFGLLHGFLVCLALRHDVATMAIITSSVGLVVSTLREVRDRRSLVRTSLVSGLGLAAAVLVFGLMSRPLDATFANTPLPDWLDNAFPIVVAELLWDALLCAAGMLIVGGLTLFALPLIERVFNVITGMTLTDLRDPKQPLLRELQLRAPGTYTHSLNVASIAEQAAEAINADSLLTYVGALYHDVGKMNKPEYFVENQTAGINRHDRLSPAMSLLIVVGHVKDGMELAREFKLPVRLQHFIEAHHGTTLVEYFFHRAKQRALEAAAREGLEDEEEATLPDEFEYRYPGPKPRTKEAAILMISDASESACRAMGEPTPAKIDALVRSIANRRLQDGQFDDCEITLKELNAIVESVVRTLVSMYHGRIAYPGASTRTAGGTPRTTVTERKPEPPAVTVRPSDAPPPSTASMPMPQSGLIAVPSSTQMITLPKQ